MNYSHPASANYSFDQETDGGRAAREPERPEGGPSGPTTPQMLPSAPSSSSSQYDKIFIDAFFKDRERQGSANLERQIARQRGRIDELTLELSRCKVEQDAVRKAFLSHIQTSQEKGRAAEEANEKLRRENEMLRRRLEDFVKISSMTTSMRSSASSTATAAGDVDCLLAASGNSSDSDFPRDVMREIERTTPSDSVRLSVERMRGSSGSLRPIPEPFPEQPIGYVSVHPVIKEERTESDRVVPTMSTRRAAQMMFSESVMTEKASVVRKVPVRCQSEGLIVGFGGRDNRNNSAAKLLSKMRANNNSKNNNQASSSAEGADSSQNASWGLIRPNGNNRANTSSSGNKYAPAVPNPSPQNPLWNLLRSSEKSTTRDDATSSSGKGLARSNGQHASAHALRSNNHPSSSSDRSGGRTPSQNSIWGMLTSSDRLSSLGGQTAREAAPAAVDNSSQNSTWGPTRPKGTPRESKGGNDDHRPPSSSDDRSAREAAGQHAGPTRNSTWGLARPEAAATTTTGTTPSPRRAESEPSPKEFGASGDDWSVDDEEEDGEERIRRLIRERAARRQRSPSGSGEGGGLGRHGIAEDHGDPPLE